MSYFENILIFLTIYVILSVSQNLIMGVTGMLNLGHAAFFGIGAYTSALLVLAGVPFWIAFLAAAIVSSIFGLLIAFPSLRLRGDYLAIATVGFGEIIRAVMKNWVGLTRGPLGLPGIPKPILFGIKFGAQLKFFVLSFIIMLITIFIINRIVKSPFGRVLKAIREDEVASQSLGKNITKYKIISFMVGAFFAGIAGSLFAHHITFIDPTTFNFNFSVFIVTMVVLGGLGSIRGAILGAIVLALIPEPLRFLNLGSAAIGAVRLMLFSVILIALIIYKPNGLLGEKVKNG